MIVRAYLVLGPGRGGRITARRVTQTRPALEPTEALVRLKLELPEDVLDVPLITVPVERREVAVAVEVEPPLDEEAA